MKQRTVLHIFGRLSPGGAETRTIDLMRQAELEGFRFLFAVLSDVPGELEHDARDLGASVVRLGRDPLWPLRLRRLTKEHDVEVVHSHVATASGAFLFIAFLSRVERRVAHFRSDADSRSEGGARRIYRWVMRLMIRAFATDVVGVSPSALEFAGLNPRMTRPRLHVIPSGLDTARFDAIGDRESARRLLGIASDEVVIVHIGRPLASKNRTRAIRRLKATLDIHPRIVMAMVGRTEVTERSQLEAVASDMGVAEALLFLGQRDDVPRILLAADVCLVTSTREGLPGVVLESIAAGTPVVASDVPGAVWISDHLDGVRILSLGQSDDTWAAAAIEAANRPRRPVDEATGSLNSSIFGINFAAESFARLWGAER